MEIGGRWSGSVLPLNVIMPLYFVSKARGTAQTGAKVAKRRSKTGKIERERQEKANKNRFFAPDCARSNALRAPPPAGNRTPAAGKEKGKGMRT